jgi:TolA-binding protein
MALSIVSAAGVLIAFFSLRARPLDFVVGQARAPGRLGVWLAATPSQQTPLAFSDGSRMLLHAGTQARVVSTSEHGARIVIERGMTRSDVVPRPNSDWSVIGGPFEIRVTGTSFDADWQPEQQTLRVTMHEGHVIVRADCLAAPRALGKGESVALACPVPGVAEASKPASSAWNAPLSSSAATPAPSAEVAESRSRVTPRASEPANPLPPAPAVPAAATPTAASARPVSFLELARQGNYKAALAAAEQADFDAACRTLSAAELLELGTLARLAGNPKRATAAYTALRQRFAGTDSAATAAFHLGQMAFDRAGDYAEAKQWFATYLGERPAGVLATEALGRKMEAEQRSGDLSAARSTAALYLSRYPAGAHARLATSLSSP